MNDHYPHPTNPGQTHWNGCWKDRGHHNCAVAYAMRLEAAIRKHRLDIWGGTGVLHDHDIELYDALQEAAQ